jgi:hypothetical protein
MMDLLLSLAGLVVGGGIGFAFGTAQDAALRRQEKRQEMGRLSSGWAMMPGSAGRVTSLLLILVAVQVLCPMLFDGNVQWLVSAGVVIGYGWTLLQQLRRRLSPHV